MACPSFLFSQDASARRQLICNVVGLVNVTKGKNIIFTSQATNALRLRSPYDIMNLGRLFGLNQAVSKMAVSTNCRAVLLRGKTRAETAKSTISVAFSEALLSQAKVRKRHSATWLHV
eukprot:m.142048 g.142048  ORF g.142048 m.142048 type:complete len:118 (+) comp24169_c0_seq2:249-602(+)